MNLLLQATVRLAADNESLASGLPVIRQQPKNSVRQLHQTAANLHRPAAGRCVVGAILVKYFPVRTFIHTRSQAANSPGW